MKKLLTLLTVAGMLTFGVSASAIAQDENNEDDTYRTLYTDDDSHGLVSGKHYQSTAAATPG